MDSPSEPSRPSKKRRTSQEPGDSNEPATSVVKKSIEFWLEDGNIVLQTSTTQFRVHKSVLKIHSSFFRDMFTVPQPDDGPMVDGCPLIPVSDTDADWVTMLKLMYHTESTFDDTTHVSILSSDYMLTMLGMGQKYGFDRFKQEALKQVHRLFPRTLDGLDDLIQRERAKSNQVLQAFQEFGVDHLFKTLKVFTELRIESALPMLYYFCIRERSLKDIFIGCDPSDPTVYLTKDMQVALAIGKEQLVDRYGSTTYRWWRRGKVSATCTTPEKCKKAARFVLLDLSSCHNEGNVMESYHDALESDDFEGFGLCPECRNEAMKSHNASRQVLLDELPSIFGLPPWDQLKDF